LLRYDGFAGLEGLITQSDVCGDAGRRLGGLSFSTVLYHVFKFSQ
jgi:hypothetical protein